MATTYIVQRGDTIFGIARKFGIKASAIIAANNLSNPNLIHAGLKLIIPIPDTPTVPPWYTPLPSSTRPTRALPLKQFPRPANDNGRGIHFGLDLRDESLTTNIARLVELRIRWTVFYCGDEMQAERAAQAAWKAGVMPIIRPACKIDGKQPLWANIVERLKAHNIPAYIEIYNEPGDDREWNHKPPDDTLPQIFGSKWGAAAVQVLDAGGFPGLQILGLEELMGAVNALKAAARTDIWNRTFFSLHNYGANHPPAYPYDPRNQHDHPRATILDDDTAVLSFIEFAKWMFDQIGFVLPMIGTEGGWQFNAAEDNRYPQVNKTLHAQYHVEMYEWFRKRILSNGQPLPDYLISVSPWILSSWGIEDWFGGPLGTKTETVNAVKALSPFVRKFSWDP